MWVEWFHSESTAIPSIHVRVSFIDSVLSVSSGRDLCSGHSHGIAPTYNAPQCDPVEVRGVPKLSICVLRSELPYQPKLPLPLAAVLQITQDNVMLVSKKENNEVGCSNFSLIYRP